MVRGIKETELARLDFIQGVEEEIELLLQEIINHIKETIEYYQQHPEEIPFIFKDTIEKEIDDFIRKNANWETYLGAIIEILDRKGIKIDFREIMLFPPETAKNMIKEIAYEYLKEYIFSNLGEIVNYLDKELTEEEFEEVKRLVERL